MDYIKELEEFVVDYGSAPTLEGMERRTLQDKGIGGPTGAHIVEEIQTPFNFSYITATTGTTAFQNLVGVTHNEISERVKVVNRAFTLLNIPENSKVLFSYAPLVSVFSYQGLKEYGIEPVFMVRSQRDAFLLSLCKEKPIAVVGESTFMKFALLDAVKSNLLEYIPKGIKFICAGTPLDVEFIEVAKDLVDGEVHDLYGCQEFGFLTLDGRPLRDDISLLQRKDDYYDFFVGGLPTGDCFAYSKEGHLCSSDGFILTYSRIRQKNECEVIVRKTTAQDTSTVSRLAKTILRIKSKIIKVPDDLEVASESTELELTNDEGHTMFISGEKTKLFNDLLQAQIDYQSKSKTDPAWVKTR